MESYTSMQSIHSSLFQYYKNIEKGTVVKIDPKGFLFTVTVIGFKDKSYTHLKKCEAFDPEKLAFEIVKFKGWEKARFQDYLNKLKDYHSMEKYHKPATLTAWEAMKRQGIELGYEFL